MSQYWVWRSCCGGVNNALDQPHSRGGGGGMGLSYLSAWRIETACVCDSCGVVTAQLGVRAEWGAASRRSVGIATHYGYEDDSGK